MRLYREKRLTNAWTIDTCVIIDSFWLLFFFIPLHFFKKWRLIRHDESMLIQNAKRKSNSCKWNVWAKIGDNKLFSHWMKMRVECNRLVPSYQRLLCTNHWTVRSLLTFWANSNGKQPTRNYMAWSGHYPEAKKSLYGSISFTALHQLCQTFIKSQYSGILI